jgi:hypothetical protein
LPGDPVHYEGWKQFKEGRSGIEREFSRVPAAFRTAVRWLPIGTPADVAI